MSSKTTLQFTSGHRSLAGNQAATMWASACIRHPKLLFHTLGTRVSLRMKTRMRGTNGRLFLSPRVHQKVTNPSRSQELHKDHRHLAVRARGGIKLLGISRDGLDLVASLNKWKSSNHLGIVCMVWSSSSNSLTSVTSSNRNRTHDNVSSVMVRSQRLRK